ncbi:helix-turn-helix domain-containing protein [Corynebacterium uropygiale]|uniref:helix-turn-helix domain-containing protein n=1 Tax=Corynebacterium uropygiale TaxID=1775911 RepID=UPI003B82E901
MATSTTKRTFTPEQCISMKINQLLFTRHVTKKALAEAIGTSPSNLGRKVRGDVVWAIDELYAAADFFGLDVVDLLPRRVTPQGQEKSPSTEVKGDDLVAGAGFEPTTSGL